ncbi:MAG: hypothetical protein U9M90_03100 [Patescibacteria group bacterium]|nr:hypothetical protein [Patescibacteria group bacterium]
MKKISLKKWFLVIPLYLIFSALILFLSLRGLPGNPIAEELNSDLWQKDGPFDSSNDRGRFALLYSFIENGSLQFSLPVAEFAVPDLAINSSGQYVSLFAPGVSFIVLPGYFLGKFFGASQVGVYSIISLFALFNVWLIYSIVMRFGANRLAALLSAFVFLFATPAFSYAVALSQHHISTFTLLFAIYFLIRWSKWWAVSLVWFLCALSIVVDNPNLFLMLPIAIYALGRIIVTEKNKRTYRIKIKPLLGLTFLTMLLPIGFFLWFNQESQGNPFQLSGTLERVLAVKEKSASRSSDPVIVILEKKVDEEQEKKVVGFFETRNLLSGFRIHFFSPDRGIIYFTPVILLGIFGLTILYRRHLNWALLIISTIGMNVLLYSMWGDPWGGWAFGSRYLIPTYALLAIGLGVALTCWRRSVWLLALFFALFAYSAAVNTLGALTSNANPPQEEVLSLEKITGKEQKYTYARNWQYLQEKGSKSFVYQSWGNNYFSAKQYYFGIFFIIAAAGLLMVIFLAGNSFSVGNKK